MAAKKLLFPEPLRPTTTFAFRLKGPTITWSRYDLKPYIVN